MDKNLVVKTYGIQFFLIKATFNETVNMKHIYWQQKNILIRRILFRILQVDHLRLQLTQSCS